MKISCLLVVVFTLFFGNILAQTSFPLHQLTPSCMINAQGKILINSGGQTTNAVSQNVFLRDSLHVSAFDTTSNAYKLSQRDFYLYDNGGLLKEISQLILSKNGLTWVKAQKKRFQYSGFQLFEESFHTWNTDSVAYLNSSKYLYTYENDNSLKSILNQPWDVTNMEWDYSTADVVLYAPNGDVNGLLTQKWNKNLNRWDNLLRINFAYTSGNISEKIYETWNTNTLEWDSYQKESITYSGSNMEITVFYASGSDWSNFQRKNVVFENSQIKSVTEYAWNGSWKETIKSINTYNANNLIDEVSKQNWAVLLNAFRNNILEKSYYSQREIFGFNEKPQVEILVNNPISSNQEFSIKGLNENQLYTVELIDITGKSVFKTRYLSGEKIVLGSQIKNGVYVLHISSDNNLSKVQKVIVTR